MVVGATTHRPVALQAWQDWPQSALQQTPSVQKPLAQSLSLPHIVPLSASPFTAVHCPLVLQACPAVQVSWVPFSSGSAAHVPLPVTSHAWHAPVQAVLQQTPSTHGLLTHSLLALQLCPLLFRQVPPAMHTLPALQVSC